MNTATDIEALLRERLAPLDPLRFELADDSHLHAGHAGAREGGHYRLLLVSTAFAGKNTVARHRAVFSLVGDLMRTRIHALGIKALAPEEI
ncbi:MAG: BolA family transcriptional regulator [Betaproteobacteria bacterium]|uniref:BolA family transcriptional regulator n=1 Tax=Candidatus Proximibacter danicus TaxID=2954365 RepID=A0A9D7K1U7_9PROT|nr:BolA family transcriptional regulator [Candidatus Proximibacter danicus]MBK9445606.1 BolA family transcriptional regulator [Betaproteobacteria bacterium]